MTKQIKVSIKNHQKLIELKKELELPSIDEVITILIETQNKYDNAKIVRLVE